MESSHAETAMPVGGAVPGRAKVPVTSAPTSTWVVFEEVEPSPPPVVFDQVRVPQSDGDVKGAFYWYPSGTHGPGRLPKPFEHAGEVFDQCRIEDAYFGRHGREPSSGDVWEEFRREWFRYFSPGDCRGPDLALTQPLLSIWPGRYFTFDDEGRQSPDLLSPDDASEWYREQPGLPGAVTPDALPVGMVPAGVGMASSDYGILGSSVPAETAGIIEYSDVADPLDEVRVLPGTVALGADGVLRGLVRNWSRMLWAYGVVVSADGREWLWPLSIQPGETAPFEIGGWDGPAEAASIDFAVTAEMSNDSDLSRAWFFWRDAYHARDYEREYGGEPSEDRYRFERMRPMSHPSLEGRWEPSLELSLVLYMAELSPDATVAEVRRPEFGVQGGFRDKQRHDPEQYLSVCDSPHVGGCYPHRERWAEAIDFFVDASDVSAFQAWIGVPHARADR